jgi:hypothetical protein
MSRSSRVLVIVAVAAVVLVGWLWLSDLSSKTTNLNDIKPVGSQGYLPAAWVVVAPS